MDQGVTLEQVEKQVAVYRDAALYFHRAGMLTYVRDEFDGVPKDIIDTDETGSRSVEVTQIGT